MEKVSEFIAKYRYALIFCYIPFYFFWFTALENRTKVEFNYMHCVVDDLIPFCEYFIIPYLFWFLYIAVGVIFLAVQVRRPNDFFRMATVMIMGMTTCLLIYTVFPNAQSLRPDSFANDNVFSRMVARIYSTDTDTNVFPSIHVFNSLAIHVGIVKSRALRRKKKRNAVIKAASLVCCVLICYSTMALKQHSFLDVVAGLILYAVIYQIVYRPSGWFSRSYRQKNKELGS